MVKIFEVLIALAKAVPAVYGLIDSFTAWYAAKRYNEMKKELREGIRKAVYEYDQTNLEEAIGSPVAGKPSGIPGTVIVDSPPPGVQK